METFRQLAEKPREQHHRPENQCEQDEDAHLSPLHALAPEMDAVAYPSVAFMLEHTSADMADWLSVPKMPPDIEFALVTAEDADPELIVDFPILLAERTSTSHFYHSSFVNLIKGMSWTAS